MTIALVQVAAANTLSPAFSSNTTPGNAVFACIGSFASVAQSVSGITLGGAADNWAQLVAGTTSVTQQVWGTIWADFNCAQAAKTVAISGTGISNTTVSGTNGGVVIFEFSGLGKAPALDKSASSDNGGTGSTTWDSGPTAQTTMPQELWLGAVNTFASINSEPGAPWSATAGGSFMSAGYQIRSTTGIAEYTGGQASAAKYSACVAAVKGTPSTAAGTTAWPYDAVYDFVRRRVRG